MENQGRSSGEVFSTGIAPLDALLPQKGFPRGVLVEWLGRRGSGVDLLAFLAARPALADGRLLIVVDQEARFYPPAVAPLVDLAQVIVVRPEKTADALWALEQSLRCPGVAATLCRLDRIRAPVLRRLQLAAERGGGLGFLIRPPAVQREAGWSEARLLVESCSASAPASASLPPAAVLERRWVVKLLRCRRGATGEERQTVLSFDESTHSVSEAGRQEAPFIRRAARA
jgi:protein ImuA